MPQFDNIDLNNYPDPINALDENEAIIIGDLHGNALKLVWTLVQSGVMVIEENEYEKLTNIYQTPAEQLTCEHINSFNQIIADAEITSRHLKLIGDELCDRGQNDYFTLVVLNKLKQVNMPVEIMLSNHSIEFLTNYQNNTLRAPKTTIPGYDNSIQGLSTLINNNLISEQEITYLVESAYKPCLRLLSHSHDENNNQTLYTHAPSALEIVIALAKKYGIKYRGSQEHFAHCIDAINQYFHDNFDQEIASLADKLNDEQLAFGVGNPVSLEHPIVRLLWHRAGNIESIKELNLPDWLSTVHGHEGDVRRYLNLINNQNADQEGFVPIVVDDENPAQSYHERMLNVDNDLGKYNLTGAYHYHTTTDIPAELTFEQPLDLEVASPTAMQRFAFQLISDLKQGNTLLFNEQQVIWEAMNPENDLSDITVCLNELTEEQARLIYAAIHEKEGSLKDIITQLLQDRYEINLLAEDDVEPLLVQINKALKAAIDEQEDDEYLIFKANARFNLLIDDIQSLERLDLDNERKEKLIDLIKSSILANGQNISAIKNHIMGTNLLLASENENDHIFAYFLQDNCQHLWFRPIAASFSDLSNDKKQAIITELTYRRDNEDINIGDNFFSHVERIVNKFRNQERYHNRIDTTRDYLAANNVTLSYALVEAHSHITSELTDESYKVIAHQLALKVEQYCQSENIETLLLSDLEECYEYAKSLIQGNGENLKNLDTEIEDNLELGEKFKRIVNQNITSLFNQHASAKNKLNELADKIFRINQEEESANPYSLSFFSGNKSSYSYTARQPEENDQEQTRKVSVKITDTMKKMMDWVEKARQGKITTRQAQYQIARLGKEACLKHGILDNDNTAKGQVYLFASKLQTDNPGLQIEEQLCKQYCLKMRSKIIRTNWDIRSPAGKSYENNLISQTMHHMIEDIRKAARGLATWTQVYKNIKVNAARAACRHANEGKRQARSWEKIAPFSLYHEIATSSVLEFSHKEAVVTLDAIKRDMDALIEESNIQKKIMGFVIGGTTANVNHTSNVLGIPSKLKIPKNLAKMYQLYQQYAVNPECACQALDEIMKVAQKASINDHWLRRSDLHAFYKKVAKDEYAVSESLVSPNPNL
ncbi:hypothetical protein E3983_07965 [Legionella israelensis]|uniref:WipA-like phosphatase domain-containing protein n=1 Tax=Legionella israelensis TaxID=454 RepID=A0AAX1EGY0_9GAMM|nr:hypothetical protein [Legionella israelensis]QBR84302.1 hypothetical protein E3983_07965 [Legionella israelensis]